VQRLCGLTIEAGLLLLVVGTPLAFGTVYPWGLAGLELVALFLALAWALTQLQERRLQWVRTPLNWPILLFLSLVGLQLLPLPPALLRLVSPHTYELYQRTLSGWPDRPTLPLIAQAPVEPDTRPQASSAVPPGFGASDTSPWRPLSLYPHATWEALRQALTYAVAYLIVVNTVQTRRQLVHLLLALLAVGGFMAVLGLIQKASGTARIYWWWQPQFGGAPFGPYVNRNHFAGYMAMVFPIGLGWLWGQLAQRGSGMAGWGWQERFKHLVNGRDGRRLLLVCALVNMAAALLVSASRGGIISLAAALVCFTLLVGLPRRPERRLGLVVIPVVLASVLAYALWLGLDHVVERFFQPEEGRPLIWSGTFKLIGDYPLLGTGLGTYGSSVRRHKPTLDAGLVDHAHNDYLELWAEVGLLGFLVVVGGLGWCGWRTLKRWSARHDPEIRGLVLGGLAGVCAIGVHSLVDFNLHIPANALTCAVILGLIAVAVHLRGHPDHAVAVFHVTQVRLPRLLCLALSPLLVLAALVLGLPVLQRLAADQQAQREPPGARGQERCGARTAARGLGICRRPGPWPG
jgi:O-antigen ligase